MYIDGNASTMRRLFHCVRSLSVPHVSVAPPYARASTPSVSSGDYALKQAQHGHGWKARSRQMDLLTSQMSSHFAAAFAPNAVRRRRIEKVSAYYAALSVAHASRGVRRKCLSSMVRWLYTDDETGRQREMPSVA